MDENDNTENLPIENDPETTPDPNDEDPDETLPDDGEGEDGEEGGDGEEGDGGETDVDPDVDPDPLLPPDDAEEAEEEAVHGAFGRDYAALARRDLWELQAEFPELTALHDLCELPDPARYGELRDLGCSPKEAYLATRPIPAKRPDNRAHLHSAVPSPLHGADDVVSVGEIARVRALFSDLTDAQIRALYKRVNA